MSVFVWLFLHYYNLQFSYKPQSFQMVYFCFVFFLFSFVIFVKLFLIFLLFSLYNCSFEAIYWLSNKTVFLWQSGLIFSGILWFSDLDNQWHWICCCFFSGRLTWYINVSLYSMHLNKNTCYVKTILTWILIENLITNSTFDII